MNECSQVVLTLDEAGKIVLAKITASVQGTADTEKSPEANDATHVTEDFLRNELLEKFEHFLIIEPALKKVMKCCADNKEDQCIELAHLKPYKIILQLSEDKEQVIARGFVMLGDAPFSEKSLKALFEEQRLSKDYKIEEGVYDLILKETEKGGDKFEVLFGKKLYADVSVAVDRTGKQLVAKVVPKGCTEQLTEENLVERLNEFSEFVIGKYDNVVEACSENSEALVATVGFKREPLVELVISADGKTVGAKVSHAAGRDKITKTWIEAQFRMPEFQQYYIEENEAVKVIAFCEKNIDDQMMPIGSRLHMEVTLNVGEDKKFVSAMLQPLKSNTEFTMDWLDEQFKQEMFREYKLAGLAGAALLELCERNTGPKKMNVAQKHETKVVFEKSKDGKTISAVATPCECLEMVTSDWITQQFVEGELQDYLLQEDKVEELLSVCIENRKERTLVVGQRRGAKVVLSCSEDSLRVLADMTPRRGDVVLDKEGLEALFVDTPFFDYFRQVGNIELLLEQCEGNEEPFEIEVATRKDASLIIDISEDKLTVIAQYDIAYGGDNIDKDFVIKAVAASKVSNGVIKAQLIGLIKKLDVIVGPCSWLIAKGSAPQRGLDSQFVDLTEKQKEDSVQEDSDNLHAVNIRSVGDVLAVKKGQPVMRLDAPEDGIDGENIYSEVIVSEPGEPIEYASELEGVEPDSTDPNILVACLDGMPVLVDNGITVQQIYKVENVGVNTGDVKFRGCVHVKGDVDAGASIECTGTIVVDGMVQNACLKAKGDIRVKGGVVGEYPEVDSSVEFVDVDLPWRCKVESEGTITVNYVSSAALVAGKSVVVNEYSSHSVLTANEDIIVGTKKTSSIIGGRATATQKVLTKNIGNDVGVKTLVEVGGRVVDRPEIKALLAAIEAKEVMAGKLKAVIEKTKIINSGESKILAVRAVRSIQKIVSDVEELTEKIEIIKSQRRENSSESIIVENKIFSAVSVVVHGHRENFTRVKPGGELILKDGELAHNMNASDGQSPPKG